MKRSTVWKLCAILALALVFPLVQQMPVEAATEGAPADLPAGLAAIFSNQPILMSSCNATATCDFGAPISCSGTFACVAADANCSIMERGYVACDTTQIDCPSLCPDLCLTYNRRWPGCNYTYSVSGSCCFSTNPSCPAVNFCG
jgi:hypothetical protein